MQLPSSRFGYLAPLAAIAAALSLAACSRPADDAQSVAQAGPAPAKPDEDVKSFAIGKLSAMALRDGSLTLPNDNAVFGLGLKPADVAEVLGTAGLPTDSLHLSLHPLLVKSADRVMLFDTGAGSNMGPDAGHLPASLAAAGVEPENVTDIFISHVHGDHVGGLVNGEGKLAFMQAAIHMSAPEWAYLKELAAASAKKDEADPQATLVAALTPKVAPFAPGAEIVPGTVKAIEIMGHTPGHSGYLITSGDDSLFYVGDAVHHYVVSVQKPDWLLGFDTDKTTAAASRGALLAQVAASGQRIYAFHFPFPGIGTIQKREEGFVWVPE
jgi:glyoxylase-like metal-dependent hydrolase (beta-lactamase superfamily II)